MLATVFAGADIEATDRARQYFTGYPPSSPSIGLLRDGKLVYMLERSEIETPQRRDDRGGADAGVRQALREAAQQYGGSGSSVGITDPGRGAGRRSLMPRLRIPIRPPLSLFGIFEVGIALQAFLVELEEAA